MGSPQQQPSQLAAQSTWMKAQKYANPITPGGPFQVAQMSDGNSVFFSLGTDPTGEGQKLYATREIQASGSGWTLENLSDRLSSHYPDKSLILPKSFSVSVNNVTSFFDFALIVTVNNVDNLHLSYGNDTSVGNGASAGQANNTDSWIQKLTWTAPITFDDKTYPYGTLKTIRNASVMYLEQEKDYTTIGNICVVDIVRPTDSSKIDRFFVSPPPATPAWAPHEPAVNLSSSAMTCLGCRDRDRVSGLYTLGVTNDAAVKLLFTPRVNAYVPGTDPDTVTFTLPNNATAIASGFIQLSAASPKLVSNLYVSGSDGITVFSHDAQVPTKDQPYPVGSLIITDPMTANASKLSVATEKNLTSLWGINTSGVLFYSYCTAGQECDSSKWSKPTAIRSDVVNYAFYLSQSTQSHVLFSHTMENQQPQQIFQHYQDPVTADWIQHQILVPTVDPSDFATFNTFQTRIELTDSNQIPVGNKEISIKSVSPIGVLVNDNTHHEYYFLLDPGVGTSFTTDPQGAVTLVQQANTLASVAYHVELVSQPDISLIVIPGEMARATVAGAGMDVLGTDSQKTFTRYGETTPRPLVPTTVGAQDRTDVQTALQNFAKYAASSPPPGSAVLPADGSPAAKQASSPRAAARKLAAQKERPRTIFTVHLHRAGVDRRVKFFHGEATEKPAENPRPGRIHRAHPQEVALDLGDDLLGDVRSVGDFFCQAYEDIKSDLVQLAVKVSNEITYITATIGKAVYSCVLDCMAAITHACEFVLSAIEVLVDDLIAWVGFLFSWGDILNTHNAMKGLIVNYAKYTVGNINNFKSRLPKFSSLNDQVSAWGNTKADGVTAAGTAKSGSASSSSTTSSPQSNWGLMHMKSNAPAASLTSPSESGTVNSSSLVTTIKTACDNEKDSIKTAIQGFQDDINVANGNVIDILTKIGNTLTSFILSSADNVVDTLLSIFADISSVFMDMVNAPIDIPVLSKFYEGITNGSKLSILDLLCLVAAIPATLLYKFPNNPAPFSADSTLFKTLAFAPDFGTVQDYFAKKSQGSSSLRLQNNKVRLADAAADDDDDDDWFTAVRVTEFFACFGIVASAIVGAVKDSYPKGVPPPPFLGYVTVPICLLSLGPTIVAELQKPTDSSAVLNSTIGAMVFCKACADASTSLNELGWSDGPAPVLDFFLNGLWLIPTFELTDFTSPMSARNISSLISSVSADLAGMTGSPGSLLPPPYNQAASAFAGICNCIAGLACIAQASSIK